MTAPLSPEDEFCARIVAAMPPAAFAAFHSTVKAEGDNTQKILRNLSIATITVAVLGGMTRQDFLDATARVWDQISRDIAAARNPQ